MRGNVDEGNRGLSSNGSHDQTVRPVDTLVLKPVAGVTAGQGAQHQHPRHEAEIGVRFAGRDKLIHLISLGEVVQRLGRGMSAFTGPSRPPKTSPMGRNPSRLRCMLYSPMFPRQPHNKPTTGKRSSGRAWLYPAAKESVR